MMGNRSRRRWPTLPPQWREQQEEARRLDKAIAKNLEKLGFGDRP